MRGLNWRKTACAACVLCAATAIALPAQTFTTLFSFDNTDGSSPFGGLVQGTNGYLYGTTSTGGAHDYGTIFKISPSGTLTTLHSFFCSGVDCPDGTAPQGGLVQGRDGNFYGTTLGTVFEMTPNGKLTTLYVFCLESGCADGESLYAGLTQATDGSFYGTTAYGGAVGACLGEGGCGTVFKITPTGALTTLHSFEGTDGAYPKGALVQGSDGNVYGTTFGGGTSDACATNGVEGCGTVFKITPSGTLTMLHSFTGYPTDGEFPNSGLAEGSDANFYGTTTEGGATGYGIIFEITAGGTLTTLHTFDYGDGGYPEGGLVRVSNGNFYGTTYGGGANGNFGTVFEITPSGTLTTLHSFAGYPTDGANPWAVLVQDTNGNFYGTTAVGGGSDVCFFGCGTVFSLSVGLRPFVETQPTFGKVGSRAKILGTNLTGTTSVTFNGTAATFTVFSSSLIGTTVPAGATSGTVQVVTPSGTLSSNVPFRVEQ